jgi:hypothetical protein
MEAYYQGTRSSAKAKRRLGKLGFVPKGKGKGQQGKAPRFGKGQNTSSSSGTEARKKASVCRDCGNVGHWRGDAECPKVKSGEVKPFGKGKGRSAHHAFVVQSMQPTSQMEWEVVGEAHDRPATTQTEREAPKARVVERGTGATSSTAAAASSAEPAETSERASPSGGVTEADDGLEARTVRELQEMLKSLNLPRTGRKAELIRRIREARSAGPREDPAGSASASAAAASSSATGSARPEAVPRGGRRGWMKEWLATRHVPLER